MNIFLFASCRVHRPFNYDNTNSSGFFNNYNCLDTKWTQPNFIGLVYCSNYILMLIKILLSRNILDKHKLCVPYQITDEHFYQICDSFAHANTIIVEIATLKFFKKDDMFLSKEELPRYSRYTSGSIDEIQLSKNIIDIQNIIQKVGKQVLFVSHFLVTSTSFERKLAGRQQIIDCLSKHATYFFDPTPIVKSGQSTNVVDLFHYSPSVEVLIMNELHKHLQIIQSKHF